MKILITGAFGQLGRAISTKLKENNTLFQTGRSLPDGQHGIYLDIQNKLLVKEVIDLTNPDLIINAAAMTNVDGCENNPDLAKEINIAGVQHLCESFDGKIIHLSTDYVFDGTSGPYSETDNVNPISIYGETKLASERIILSQNKKHLVIRGNVIYDDSNYTNASFLNWVVNSLKENQSINVVNDQFNNPTWTESLADVIAMCCSNEISGLWHWGDGDLLSRFDFALKIANAYELDSSLIQPISTKELNQKAPRPLKSGLKPDNLAHALNIIPPKIDDCLNAIINRNV